MSNFAKNALRQVILRDDDTNALTPIECLEKLYRPFLAHGLPVNLATIPEVREDARTPDGQREGFLPRERNPAVETVSLGENRALVDYLHANPGYHVVQHGCYHDAMEFDGTDRTEIVRRLDRGALRLREAGFKHVQAFVAPHDKLSSIAYDEASRRFRVISTGWFEWRRLPASWRPRYLVKKLAGRRHWQVGRTVLLGHPGCILSHRRPFDTMLEEIKRAISREETTVLVTHWWEYFRDGRPDTAFIDVLHRVADYLATRTDVSVTTFDALARSNRGTATARSNQVRPTFVAAK